MNEATLNLLEPERGVESVMTPEGVSIKMRVAPFGRRATAFCLDFLFIGVAMFALILASVPLMTIGDQVGGALALLTWFALLNFYFPLFEGLRGGMTPGKSIAKVRVIDRNGGALTLRGVFTRNFMRDLELWLPLKILLFGSYMLESLPSWATPFAFLWALLMFLFPLFNSRRLRLGDLVSGTMVVEQPRMHLLRDMAVESKPSPRLKRKSQKKQEASARPSIEFTPEQLSFYGIYELQVLEDVLRGGRETRPEVYTSVAVKIREKIGWRTKNKVSSREFLEAFYAAQRSHLEQQMLMGKKKLSKHDD